MTESPPTIEILALSQAIMTAHQESAKRQERLLEELPKSLVPLQHYEARHADLEQQVRDLKGDMKDMQEEIHTLPERIMQRIEARSAMSRAQMITITIAVLNGLIAITLGVVSFLHH